MAIKGEWKHIRIESWNEADPIKISSFEVPKAGPTQTMMFSKMILAGIFRTAGRLSGAAAAVEIEASTALSLGKIGCGYTSIMAICTF